jgi:hypothetical protein
LIADTYSVVRGICKYKHANKTRKQNAQTKRANKTRKQNAQTKRANKTRKQNA